VRVSADPQSLGNSDRDEVDGNRLPAAPSGNGHARGAPGRDRQPQTHARPSTPRQKPRPHRGQEVPALLDGNKRDD
jgi:hypothetical protein